MQKKKSALIHFIRVIRVSIAIILIGGFPPHLSAQQRYPQSSPENLFEDGRLLFQQGVYATAQQCMEEYTQNHPSSSNIQEAEYMLACTVY